MMKVANQHPQGKKKTDAQGNVRKRVFLKSGNSTMLFCSGLTKPGAEYLIKRVQSLLKSLGTRLEGSFIITQ